MAGEVTVLRTTRDHPDFVSLCHLLDEDLNERAGGAEKRAVYAAFNTLRDVHTAFVAYVDGAPTGCAAFKQYADGIAEVKRVFVPKAYRGRGAAKAVMQELEQCALELGFHTLLLETAERLPEAMSLYKKLGFEIIPQYEPYIGLEISVCMGKKIT